MTKIILYFRMLYLAENYYSTIRVFFVELEMYLYDIRQELFYDKIIIE